MIESMMTRHSVRSFSNESLRQKRERIDQICRESIKGPLGHSIELLQVSPQELEKQGIGQLATFGVISGAANYLFSIIPDTRAGLVNYGYALEKTSIILWKEGIGSCWLGGMFKKQKLEALYLMKGQRAIPAVLAIGFPHDEKSLVERIMKLATRPVNRKPLSEIVFDRVFHQPLQIKPSSKWETVFTCVQRAPSARNGQPWRIVKEYNQYHFYLRTREETELNQIDMGIAICHFDLARLELGIEGSWHVRRPLEDPEHRYFITFVREKE